MADVTHQYLNVHIIMYTYIKAPTSQQLYILLGSDDRKEKVQCGNHESALSFRKMRSFLSYLESLLVALINHKE